MTGILLDSNEKKRAVPASTRGFKRNALSQPLLRGFQRRDRLQPDLGVDMIGEVRVERAFHGGF